MYKVELHVVSWTLSKLQNWNLTWKYKSSSEFQRPIIMHYVYSSTTLFLMNWPDFKFIKPKCKFLSSCNISFTELQLFIFWFSIFMSSYFCLSYIMKNMPSKCIQEKNHIWVESFWFYLVKMNRNKIQKKSPHIMLEMNISGKLHL